MAVVVTYPVAQPKLDDLLLGTEVYNVVTNLPIDGSRTRNFTISSIASLIPPLIPGGGTVTSVIPQANGIDGTDITQTGYINLIGTGGTTTSISGDTITIDSTIGTITSVTSQAAGTASTLASTPTGSVTDIALTFNGASTDYINGVGDYIAINTLPQQTLQAVTDTGSVTTNSVTVKSTTSTQSTGLPPLVVASTTLVPNLYVDRAVLADTSTTTITNADLTGMVTSVGNAATVVTNANLSGGVTSVGNAATVITNANLTGSVTSVGNATTVVTNADLTGVITSTGNATSIASQTGSGSKFVVDTSPTLVTPNIGAASGDSLSITNNVAGGTGSFTGQVTIPAIPVGNTDATSKQYVDNKTAGALIYIGAWDASSNNPTLVSGVGTTGNYYIVSQAGTTTLDGISEWAVGDWAVFSDLLVDAWQKIDNTSVLSGAGIGGKISKWAGVGTSVTLGDSVMAETSGNIVVAGDISANNLSGTNTGDQDLSGKANLAGGNTFTGSQIVNHSGTGPSNGVEVNNTSTGKGVGVSNSSTGYGINSINTSTGTGIHSSNLSIGYGFHSVNDVAGIGIYSHNSSTGKGIYSYNISSGQGIYSSNTLGGIGIQSQNSSGGIGIYSGNTSTGKGIYSSNNSATGSGIYSNNYSSGNGIISNAALTGTGFNFIGSNQGANTFTVDKLGALTGTSATFSGNVTVVDGIYLKDSIASGQDVYKIYDNTDNLSIETQIFANANADSKPIKFRTSSVSGGRTTKVQIEAGGKLKAFGEFEAVGNATLGDSLTGTSATFSSTVTATNFILSSDERLKENIVEIQPKKIKANWKSFNIKDSDEGYRVGVIAQELEVEHPEFIVTDSEGFKSVKYIDLLISKIAELENRIKQLEG